ncbi:hypothetical protein EV421DRAFT_132964 [Armillaria borealis]|uniref:Uncharacterized protein n=1 Tax=Armillaria borealis TaxID=47425 RepID=A0AA39IWT0_9AGAR|nr:hypothetical protein EV421DRAFT_132964 [Armillaria borealis]
MIMYKQCKDLNPQRVRNAYCRLSKYSGILCISVFILSLVASLFFPISPELAIRGFTLAYLMGYLTYEGMFIQILWVFMTLFMAQYRRHLHTCTKPSALFACFTLRSLKSVQAWRDMRGFLVLIAESEGSQLSNVSHAKKFLDAFQASVCHPFSVKCLL